MRVLLNKDNEKVGLPKMVVANHETGFVPEHYGVVDMDDITHLPADMFRVSVISDEAGNPESPAILMSVKDVGLYTPMSTEIMRSLGKSLLDAADALEGLADAAAAEAIQKARGNGQS